MFLIIFLILACVYMTPGLYLARSLYSEQAREINTRPTKVVPPKPKRPEIKLNEMLHISAPRRCSSLTPGKDLACNCKNRKEWVRLKNEWLDYNEWNRDYGHIKNGVDKEPEPSVAKCLMAVPTWPVVMATLFIKGGAKNIPNYREIERMEEELKQLNTSHD